VHEGLATRFTERAAQRLAVNRDDFPFHQPRHRSLPPTKGIGERCRIQRGENPTESIVRRDPVAQLEKGAQPGLLGWV